MSSITAATHCLYCCHCRALRIETPEYILNCSSKRKCSGQGWLLIFEQSVRTLSLATDDQFRLFKVSCCLEKSMKKSNDVGFSKFHWLSYYIRISAYLGTQSDCCGVAEEVKRECIGNKLHFIKRFLI